MGAKRTPIKKETRTAELKCEFCPRLFSRPHNLEMHQKSMHSSHLKGKEKGKLSEYVKRVSFGSKNTDLKESSTTILKKAKASQIPGSKIKVLNMPLEKDRSPSPLKPEDIENSEMRSLKSTETRKIEFACPKCDKLFPVYFSALRHIKTYHCVNDDGDFVEESSEDLIKPVRTEMCIHCQVRVKSTDIHKCNKNTAMDIGELNYYCVACKKIFLTMPNFDIHLKRNHSEVVESMFFPSNFAFFKWKHDMESQTGCNYVLKGKYNSQEIYRCLDAVDSKTPDVTVFCPSTVIYQEFCKGIQVHFYPTHSGHTYQKYNLTEKYKNVTITNILNQKTHYRDFSEQIQSTEIDDLYIQFKDLMESVVIDAAKINSATLKILIGKALDMTTVLTNYDDDNDEGISKKSNLEDTNILKPCTSNGIKTENITDDIDNVEVPKKKTKRNKKFSLNNNKKDDEKILMELGDSQVISTSLRPPSQYGQITFNDSYKDFVDKTFKVDKPTTQNKVVKTKIGQFKLRASLKKKPNVIKDLKRNIVENTKKPKRLSDLPPKDIIDFDENKKKPKRLSDLTPKDIIDFEIKERDDDCNILILKI